MKHVIELVNYVVAENGVEVDYRWNGELFNKNFQTEQGVVDANSDLITNSEEAIKQFLCYLVAMAGGDPALLPGFAGKVMTIDLKQSVSLAVSIT